MEDDCDSCVELSESRDMLSDELADLQAENDALRSAVIVICDTYNARFDQRRLFAAYRHVANKTNVAFSEKAVADRYQETIKSDMSNSDLVRIVLQEIHEWRSHNGCDDIDELVRRITALND